MAPSNKKQPLTIGLLAKTAGVSVETVRFYQRRGLLGVPHKPSGRNRHYDKEHVAQLWLIRHAKELGFSLGEIDKLMGFAQDKDCRAIKTLAEQKLHAISAKIKLLQEARRTLKDLVASCSPTCRAEHCPLLAKFGARVPSPQPEATRNTARG